MLKNVDELIKSGKYPPVFLICGEEEFLLDEAYIQLKNALCNDEVTHYDMEIIDTEEYSTDKIYDKIVDSCYAYPFVSERRIVIVKHFEKLTAGKISKKNQNNPSLQKYLSNPQPSTFLIIISSDEKLKGAGSSAKNKTEKSPKALPFPYEIIIEKYEFIEFPTVYESKYPDWVVKRCQKFGKEITPDAVELLVAQTNPTLRELNNELTKILLYIGDKNQITLMDVGFIAGSSRVNNVFELQKAVGKRQLSIVLSIIENMLASERQEMLIMTMLTRYFVVLFKLIEERSSSQNNFQLAGKVGVSPYFINEYFDALKNYTSKEIENSFQYLCKADEELKSTSTDSIYILQRMLINIMDKKS
ncbi:MAG: DNA polymerase III subunit delta [FCB group bacterium]|jgi:DNA polymerase-3 subunit delta